MSLSPEEEVILQQQLEGARAAAEYFATIHRELTKGLTPDEHAEVRDLAMAIITPLELRFQKPRTPRGNAVTWAAYFMATEASLGCFLQSFEEGE